MFAIILLAADGAFALCDAGRGAVAGAVCRFDRVAAFTLAGTGVGLVSPLDCHAPQSWPRIPYSPPHFSQVLPMVQVGVSVPPV